MHINESHLKALEHLKLGDLDIALQHMNDALNENGLHPELLSDRAVVYLHLKNKELSLADFDSAINLQPNYGYRFASRAYAKDIFGDTLGGIADYQRAIELEPEDAIAHNNLGLLEEKLGRIEASKRQFEKADLLRKLEDDRNEPQGQPETTILPDNFMQPHFLPADPIQEEEKITTFAFIKQTILTKEGRSGFWVFIKNGFKDKDLGEDDKKG